MDEVKESGIENVSTPDTEEEKISERFKLKTIEEINNLSTVDLQEYTIKLSEEYISQKELNKELKDNNMHDNLTHIFNSEGIKKELARQMDKNETISILFSDLGNFKKVNDTYGHIEGNKILTYFASTILKESVKRAEDTCGRFGGDEFLLILPNTGIKGAMKVKDRIDRRIKSEKTKNPDNFALRMITPDIGIASWSPSNHDSVDEFIKRADLAMYTEKNKRKGIK